MPIRSRNLPLLLLAISVTALTALATPGASALRHTALVRSVPAKDSTARVAPSELRLWFNERIDLAVTRVRLTDSTKQPVATRALARADSAGAPIVVGLAAPLANGRYTVEWSTSSKDGHPVRGTYGFNVRVAR